MKRFKNRRQAGEALAQELMEFAGRADVIVFGLPQGGIPVAYEVAVALGVRLDALIVHKLSVAQNDNLGFGALASGAICVLDRRAVTALRVTDSQIAGIIEREALEIAKRDRAYRGKRAFPDIPGKTVIVVDDSLATSTKMRLVIDVLRKRHPACIIVAAPIASREAYETLSRTADQCVSVARSERVPDTAAQYDDFSQTEDAEVTALLETAATRKAKPAKVYAEQ